MSNESNASPLILRLSGGASNSKTNQSIGGAMSIVTVATGINNLFSDVLEGTTITDFRCFYIYNNGSSEYEIKIFSEAVAEGSSVQIGTANRTEVQRISLGAGTGGYFTLGYGELSVAINYSNDMLKWCRSIENALNQMGVGGATVRGGRNSKKIEFNITFNGMGANKSHPKLKIVNNSITGSTSSEVTKIVDGSPINRTAQLLSQPVNTPLEVEFFSAGGIISLGTLKPGEFVPVWVKRTVLPNTAAVKNDGITFKINFQDVVAAPQIHIAYFYNCSGGVVASGTATAELTLPVPSNIVTPAAANVLALLHMDGANNSTTFTDSSMYGRTVTLEGFGGGKISNVQSKFGGTSYFTNDQTWLTVGSVPAIAGDFTVDFWIYHITRGTTEYDDTVFEYNNYRFGIMFRSGPSIGASGNSQLYVVSSANKPYSTSSGWFTTGVWQHVAVVRQSGVVKIYVDGNNVTLQTDPWNNTSTIGGGDLRIGAAQHTAGQFIDGYIDEFRVCNIACFTGNFTPPAAPY